MHNSSEVMDSTTIKGIVATPTNLVANANDALKQFHSVAAENIVLQESNSGSRPGSGLSRSSDGNRSRPSSNESIPPTVIYNGSAVNVQIAVINGMASQGDSREQLGLLGDAAPIAGAAAPSNDSRTNNNDKSLEASIASTVSSSSGHPLTTNTQTMMHLLKGNIGTGVLAMPSAFAKAGLLVGTVGIVFMGIICVHCMHVLLHCNRKLSEKLKVRSLDFAGVAEQAFAQGPLRYRSLAPYAKKTVNGFLLLTQFGFCCVYFVFVAASLQSVFDSVFGPEHNASARVYLAIIFPVMIVFNYVRSLRSLAIASTIANFMQISGMILIFYMLLQDLPHTSERPAFAGWSELPLYFGTAIYAFEGIGIVLPIENEMATPEAFGGMTGVLNTGMVMVICLYTGIGFFGYLKYGQDTRGSITLNFPPGAPLSELIRVIFAVSIFLSYALQLYVPIKILWPWLKERYQLTSKHSPKGVLMFEYGLRTVLVTITFVLAAAIPQLGLFISLVGALASSSLALIIPPVLEQLTRYDEDMSKIGRIAMTTKNILICLFGVVGFLTGTYASIRNIALCMADASKCSE